MLNHFFIFIGDMALSIVNFKFPKLNLEQFKNVEDLREIFLKHYLKKQTVVIIILFSAISLNFLGLEITGIFIVLTAMLYVFMIFYPKLKNQQKYSDLNFELPYALRHIGIELKSGKGLHDSLMTVSNAGYGSFSIELKSVLEEVKYGQSTENSLLEMAHRFKSNVLSRCVQQIVGTLRVGGNLANSLEVIADDISFDMKIKLKDYAQKLNAFILIYTFVAILAPVVFLIMLMAASTVMGDIVPSNIIIILYAVFFPMVVVFMGIFIKKLEPKI